MSDSDRFERPFAEPAVAPAADEIARRAAEGLGVYLHIPFCERVCPYCDFAVVAARPLERESETRYADALLRELSIRAEAFEGLVLETVYFGGGTPSLLSPATVASLLGRIRARFAGLPVEVTLEVNPSTLECDRLPAFREAGVNRLSLGVQSFDDTVLRKLGRAHRAEESHAVLAAARAAGFDNCSVDLIYATPGQTLGSLERDLDFIAGFSPEHCSTYELTIEAGTPFATADARGQLPRVDEDEAIAMAACIEARLAATGLARYEISSFAKPGREAVHNRRYWQRSAVLGLGMGAWSVEPCSDAAPHGARSANEGTLSAYLSGTERDGGAVAEREVLSPETARGEAVFLALRQVAGLSAARFRAEFGAPPRRFYHDEIEASLGAGWLTESPGGDLALTPEGRLMSDTVFERFV